jgi:hypothetical protein
MLVALIAVAATACSGAATESALTTGGASAPSEAPAADNVPADTGANAPADTGALAPTQTDRERPEGRDAPDFALALGQGGDFTLSSETKPVYMVFWAEW